MRLLAGRLPSHGSLSFGLRPKLDGTVTVDAPRSLRLRLTDAHGRRLAAGRRSLRYVDCGKRRLRLAVTGPPGRFVVTVSTP